MKEWIAAVAKFSNVKHQDISEIKRPVVAYENRPLPQHEQPVEEAKEEEGREIVYSLLVLLVILLSLNPMYYGSLCGVKQ